MAGVTISGGEVQTRQTWQAIETLTQSTATTPRALSLFTDVSILGAGTATGHERNFYTLASGAREGQEKLIVLSATGEAKVVIAGPTNGNLPIHVVLSSVNPTATAAIDQILASATGRWVFQSDGDYILLRYFNGTWNYMSAVGATLSTGT